MYTSFPQGRCRGTINLLTNFSQWEEAGRLGDDASSLLLLTDQISPIGRRAAQQPIVRATRIPLRKDGFLFGRENLITSQQPLGLFRAEK